MNEYDYSKVINLWYTSDSDDYQVLVFSIKDELKSSGKIKRFKETHLQAIHHILADLFVTYSYDPKRYLAFSRNKGWYSIDTRYQPKRFAYEATINIVDSLTSFGYIKSVKGFKSKLIARNARMRATDKLIALFKKHTLVALDFYQLPTESIILKASNKTKKINYKDTTEASLMRENLKQINNNLGSQWIDLRITDAQIKKLQLKLSKSEDEDKSPVDFTRTNLYRVFNNGDEKKPEFNQGGRFYGGWWTSIPSKYRSRITINGKKTIELDYSAMHFYMMYAEKGLKIPKGDLYTFDGIDRGKAKLALNTALNASSKAKAISAIKKNQWPDKTKSEVKNILDKLLKNHKAISEFFFTGKGVKLQFKDSQVAESVMLNIWDKYEQIVLPVHDSFVVPAGFRSVLEAQMNDSFYEVTGYKAKIKPKLPDESLKSPLDKKGQQVEYDDDGNLTKVGVNGADTWNDYKQEQKDYSGYRSRGKR